jgi:peptide chain release factor
MDTQKIIQITSGRGPAECCLAVALALKEMLGEARAQNLDAEVLERAAGPENGTLNSAAVKISGKNAKAFAASWQGTLLWICQSPFRRYHGRKNWFIGINVFDHTKASRIDEADIIYQTMRSSGPGGQHVNKTESAVRATHVPSGISVAVRDSRSQVQNRKLALERLTEKVELWQMEQASANAKAVWQNHNELERGSPKRTYKEKEFKRIKR